MAPTMDGNYPPVFFCINKQCICSSGSHWDKFPNHSFLGLSCHCKSSIFLYGEPTSLVSEMMGECFWIKNLISLHSKILLLYFLCNGTKFSSTVFLRLYLLTNHIFLSVHYNSFFFFFICGVESYNSIKNLFVTI